MPKCDGLPEDGRCPQNVNNRSVKPSQGELMLCPSCEAIRFPYIRANAGSAARQTATKKAQSVNKKRSASTSKGTDIGKNGAVIPERQYSKSDDEDECVFCCDAITTTTDSIRCDICKHAYHQACTGLSSDVFTALTTIVSQTGWVCRQCRIQFDSMKCSLTKVNEELANMRVSLSDVIAEVNCLKTDLSKQLPTGLNPAMQVTQESTDSSSQPNSNPVTISQLKVELQHALRDATRRKQNIVVSGLPETCAPDGTTDKETDGAAFTSFCEENLSVKPPLAQSGCVRLGKSDGIRPRRLLVHLTSEHSATSVLAASKVLRQSSDTYISKNIYFNPDLNPVEAKLAYERRVHIRQRRGAATTVKQIAPLNANAVPYVTCSSHHSETADSGVTENIQHTSGPSRPSDTPSTSSDTGQLFL